MFYTGLFNDRDQESNQHKIPQPYLMTIFFETEKSCVSSR